MPTVLEKCHHLIEPRHVVAGLGGADRNLLAFSLALFDDSTLLKHLGRLYDKADGAIRTLAGREARAAAAAVEQRMTHWSESAWTDDQLRLILWMVLRDAFGLQPRLSVSMHGTAALADDLSAALIHALDPPGMVSSAKRWLEQKDWLPRGKPALTLTDIVLPVLDGLATDGLDAADESSSAREQRQEALARALARMAALSEEDQKRLLKETGASAAHDGALRNVTLIGGSLATFSVLVSQAGFSAYIAAAKASAFIPWVSGPGLVSFVAVLSNPITVVALLGLAIFGMGTKAEQRARVSVAARVVALLAVQGLSSRQEGIRSTLRSFSAVPKLDTTTGLPKKRLEAARREWQMLAPIAEKPLASPPQSVMRAMQRPLDPAEPTEGDNAILMTGLTVGDVIFNIAAINPAVVQAADFARVQDLSGTVDFAKYADDLMSRAPASLDGAVSNLKGYVAEFLVASELTAAGHVVTMPTASNEAGWDLLVDGERYQVKFHQSLQGIKDHFSRFDYPVIANTELVDSIPEEFADQVMFIDGLSNELVTRLTEDSLKAGVDVLDPGVPLGALAISVLRGVQRWQSGKLSHAQVVEQVILDGSIRVGLAAAGKVVGAGAGMLVFGPAGAWVFAAGGPILAQSQTTRVSNLLREHLKTPAVSRWCEESHLAMDGLRDRLQQLIDAKREHLVDKLQLCPAGLELGDYVRWRIADSGRFLQECRSHLEALDRAAYPGPGERFAAISRWLAGAQLYPGGYQPQLRAVVKVLKQRPALLNGEDGARLGEAAKVVTAKTQEVVGESAKATGKLISGAWDKLKGLKPKS